MFSLSYILSVNRSQGLSITERIDGQATTQASEEVAVTDPMGIIEPTTVSGEGTGVDEEDASSEPPEATTEASELGHEEASTTTMGYDDNEVGVGGDSGSTFLTSDPVSAETSSLLPTEPPLPPLDLVDLEEDTCSENVCSNGGTCFSTITGPRCHCPLQGRTEESGFRTGDDFTTQKPFVGSNAF